MYYCLASLIFMQRVSKVECDYFTDRKLIVRVLCSLLVTSMESKMWVLGPKLLKESFCFSFAFPALSLAFDKLPPHLTPAMGSSYFNRLPLVWQSVDPFKAKCRQLCMFYLLMYLCYLNCMYLYNQKYLKNITMNAYLVFDDINF